MKKLLGCNAIMFVLLSGCSTTEITRGDAHYKSVRPIFTRVGVDSIEFSRDFDRVGGTKESLSVSGVNHDTTQGWLAAFQAGAEIARTAAPAANPSSELLPLLLELLKRQSPTSEQ